MNPAIVYSNTQNPDSSEQGSSVPSATSLVQDYKNFKNSSAPSRFLYYENGSWSDFASEVFGELHDGFVRGKAAVEVGIDGNLFVIDFLRMSMINFQTGKTVSIAWIDVTGKCFFPRIALDDSIKIESRKRKRDKETDCNHCLEECTAESPAFSNFGTLGGPRWKNTRRVNKDDRLYKIVEELFLAGMLKSPMGLNTKVTSIHKCLNAGPIGALRMKDFRNRVQTFRALRGEKCVKFGWYGTNLKELDSILDLGFCTANNKSLGRLAHGIGVHISPPHSPYPSAKLAEEDKNGERHVILCRVILGQAERVEPGSTRNQPSSLVYDSGVDDLSNPNWYIIWNMYMNAHIVPEYIISLKINKFLPGTIMPESVAGVKYAGLVARTSNLLVEFPRLISSMKEFLPPSSVRNLHLSYIRWKEGKIDRDTFLRALRFTAGDKLLVATIRKIRGY